MHDSVDQPIIGTMDETAKEGAIDVYPSSVDFVLVVAVLRETEPVIAMPAFGVPIKPVPVVVHSTPAISATMVN